MEDKSNHYLKIIAIRCKNSLLILFFASIFLYSITAHSQKNHIDQNDLRNAFPLASELPAGVVNRVEVFEPDYSGSDNLNIRVEQGWRAYLSPEPAGDWIWGSNTAWYYPGYGAFETAEVYIEHYSQTTGTYGTPWLPYNELPGGLINETYKDSEGNSFVFCEILFWKSPYCVGEVMIAAQIDKNLPNNPANPPAATFYSRDSYAKAFIRTEAERLAKLIYSRLPDADGNIIPALNPDGDHATGILPAGNNPGQNGSNTPDSTPGSSLSGADLSAGALFAAVGLTALVTLFGSVGVALTNGMSLQGVWSELTAFIGSVIPGKVVEAPLEAEQAIYPEETFMETPLPEEPLSPMSTGQPTPPPPPEDVEEFWTEVETEIAEQVEIEEAKSAEPEPDHEHFAAETPEHRDPSPTLAQASDDVLKWADNWQKYQESAAKKAIDQEDLVVLTDWRKTGVPLAEIELRYQLMLSQKKGTYHFYRAVVDVATSKAKNAPLVYLGGKMATLPVKIAAGAVSAADAMADLTTAWVESKDPVQMRPILNEYIFSYDLKEEDLQRLLDQNDKLRVSIDHEVKELKVKIAELMNPRDKSFMDADALKPLSLAKEKITEVERLEAKRRYIDYQTNAYSTRLKTGWPGK
jgi:hypothetical protein